MGTELGVVVCGVRGGGEGEGDVIRMYVWCCGKVCVGVSCIVPVCLGVSDVCGSIVLGVCGSFGWLCGVWC